MSEFNEIAGCEDDAPRRAPAPFTVTDPTVSHVPSLADMQAAFARAAAQWDAGIAQTETVSAVLGNGPTLKLVKPPDSWHVLVADGPGSPAATGARDGEIAGKAEIAHLRDRISAKNKVIAELSSELYEARQALLREGVRQAVAPGMPSEDDVLSLATCLAAAHADTWFGNAKATTDWLRAARAAFDHAGYLPSIAAARADAARMTVAEKRPAPLSAPWHHLPCVTAGAAPPAPAEEPIWRALRAKGDGVVR